MAKHKADWEPLEKLGTAPKCKACEEELIGTKKICYACRRGLTGTIKDSFVDEFGECEDVYWECMCEEWECRCDEVKQSEWLFYCPTCHDWYNQSRYLRDTFTDPATRWLANMVTHWRHEHRAWDNNVDHLVNNYGQEAYDRQKATVNNQAMRVLLRKHTEYLLHHGILPEHFSALKNAEPKTIELEIKN